MINFCLWRKFADFFAHYLKSVLPPPVGATSRVERRA
jgi:hypothetical protein